ncbi:hypothetical protein Q9L58_001110 [Maublancomyces gigas]|uniref:Uncharacterized protein n=1 Tax=Discina gigas TaxID=1032678 RepID=A0ABR3GV52_9PEZI
MDDSEEPELYAAAIPADTADMRPKAPKHTRVPSRRATQNFVIATDPTSNVGGRLMSRTWSSCRRFVCQAFFGIVHACIVADSRFQGDGNTPNRRSTSNI